MPIVDRVRDAWSVLIGTKAALPSTPRPTALDGGMGVVPGRPVVTQWTAANAIREGFDASVWVQGCVTAIVAAMIAVPWRVERRLKDGKWVVDPDGASSWLGRIWEEPNPFMSQVTLLERLTMHRLLAGNGLLVKVRDSLGQPRELWPVDPDLLKPVPHPVSFVERFDVMDGVAASRLGRDSYPADDVIHMRIEDPANQHWGRSPLRGAARAVDTDVRMTEWNWFAMANRMHPDGILWLKGEVTQERYDHVVKLLKRQRQGPANARQPIVMDGEGRYDHLGGNAEMDFTQGEQWVLRKICAAFGVPAPILGVLEDATYSNYEQAEAAFWERTIVPHLDQTMEALNRGLRADAVRFGEADRRLAYDLSSVPAMQRMLGRKVDVAVKMHTLGVPLNTVDRLLDLGLGPTPAGETAFLPGGLTPADTFLRDPLEESMPGEDLAMGDVDDGP